jgi:5'-phosphate synthase pdxT subunit
VEKLALYQGEVVLARQNNILVAAFHPELTGDARVHKLFLQMLARRAR